MEYTWIVPAVRGVARAMLCLLVLVGAMGVFNGVGAQSPTDPPQFGITNVALGMNSDGDHIVAVTVERTDGRNDITHTSLFVTVRVTSENDYIENNTADMSVEFSDHTVMSRTVDFPRHTNVGDTVSAEVIAMTGYGVMQAPDGPGVITSVMTPVTNHAPVLSEVDGADKSVRESTRSAAPIIVQDDAANGSFSYTDMDAGDNDNDFGNGGIIEGTVAGANSWMPGMSGTPRMLLMPGSGGTEFVGTYGTLTLYDNGVWDYMLDDLDDDTNALVAGQTVLDSFEFRIDDGAGNIEGRYSNVVDIDISVAGTNDVPVLVADTLSVSEDTSNSTLNVLDDDSSVEETNALSVASFMLNVMGANMVNVGDALTGAWGSLSIAADGMVTWSPNGATTVDALDQGDNDALMDDMIDQDNLPQGVYIFSYMVEERGNFFPASATLTLIIEGANDAPVLSEMSGADKAVTNGSDPAANGSFAYADLDSEDTDFGSGGTIEGRVAGSTGNYTAGTMSGVAIMGTFGTLSLKDNGEWTYTLDTNDPDTMALASADSRTDSFEFRINDDGATSNQHSNTVTVQVAVRGSTSVTPPTFEITSITENASGNVDVVVSRSMGSSPHAASFSLSVTSTSTNNYVETTALSVVFDAGSHGDAEQAKTLTINRVAGSDTRFSSDTGDTVTVSINSDPSFTISPGGGSTTVSLVDLKPAFSIAATGSSEANPLIFTVTRRGSNMKQASITVDVTSRSGYVATDPVTETIAQGASSVVFRLALDTGRDTDTGDRVAVTIQDNSSYNIVQRSARHVVPSLGDKPKISSVAANYVAGTTFSPVSRVDFTVTATRGTGSQQDISVGLNVTGLGIEGTRMLSVSIPHDATEGTETLNLATPHPPGTITATIAPDTANPTTYIIEGQATATISVPSTLPAVSFFRATGTHINDEVRFVLVRAATRGVLNITGSLEVDVDITVTNDYVTSPPTTATFAAGFSRVVLHVPLAEGRNLHSGSELTMTITPQNPVTTYSVGSQNTATATVGGAPRVSVGDVGVCTSDNTKFCINLSRDVSTAVLNKVSFTLEGDANLADYLESRWVLDSLRSINGTFSATNATTWTSRVNFAAGDAAVRLTIDRNPDGITSSDVNLTVTVTSGSTYQAMGDPGMATLTDLKPAFSIAADPDNPVTATEFTFILTRVGSNQAGATVNVDPSTSAGHVADTSTRQVIFGVNPDPLTPDIQMLTLDRDSSITAGGTVTATIAIDGSYNIAAAPGNRASVNVAATDANLRTLVVTGVVTGSPVPDISFDQNTTEIHC